jgi:hypothetical protein
MIDVSFFHELNSAPSELKDNTSSLPPVAPGVIHIWLFQSLCLSFSEMLKNLKKAKFYLFRQAFCSVILPLNSRACLIICEYGGIL